MSETEILQNKINVNTFKKSVMNIIYCYSIFFFLANFGMQHNHKFNARIFEYREIYRCRLALGGSLQSKKTV